jgi:hypothetical protein
VIIVFLKNTRIRLIQTRPDEVWISAFDHAAGRRIRRDDRCASKIHNSSSDIFSNSLTRKSWLSYTKSAARHNPELEIIRLTITEKRRLTDRFGLSAQRNYPFVLLRSGR